MAAMTAERGRGLMPGKYQAVHTKVAQEMAKGQAVSDAAGEPHLNHEQERIRKWLKQVRFRKALFGGVSEADVWKKIAELDTLYEAALSAERARYDALLAERTAGRKAPSASAENGRTADEDEP